jgi:DNA-binding MarR family transcriptional regulator
MQLFEKMNSMHIRPLGFTDSQFDIIATLGNTKGMTCKELGQKTLITKGTLTGVIDRLEKKGIVQRKQDEQDRRQFFIKLTDLGQQTFEQIFPIVINNGSSNFKHYAESDFNELEAHLNKLKNTLYQSLDLNL